MPTNYVNLIQKIDPSVDAELVGDIANEIYRYFNSMTLDQWRYCVRVAKAS